MFNKKLHCLGGAFLFFKKELLKKLGANGQDGITSRGIIAGVTIPNRNPFR